MVFFMAEGKAMYKKPNEIKAKPALTTIEWE